MNLTNIQLNKQKKILIVIFFVLIAYVDISYILKAQRAGLRRLDPKIARLKTDLADFNRGLENMRSFKTKPSAPGQKQVARSFKILPDSRISELLQEISITANKFDIKITQMRPSRQTQKEKLVVGQQAKPTLMLINLGLAADYHNLGRFIQACENSPVFMEVQEFKIETQLPDYMKQKVTLVLKTYVTK